MKASLGIRIFAGWMALAVLGTVSLSSQFEPSPDHYDFAGAEPFPDSTNITPTAQYHASFILPHQVECEGTSVAAGRYPFSLLSDGRQGQATLKGKGRTLELRGFIRPSGQSQKQDALMVEVAGQYTPAGGHPHCGR